MSEILDEAEFNLKIGVTVEAILKNYLGKRVALQLDSYEAIEGVVVTVCDGLVHIAKRTDKDFYDAVVRIDRISAVRMRARKRDSEALNLLSPSAGIYD